MSGDFFSLLQANCEKKKSLLCVGLDPRIEPSGDQDIVSAILAFNRRIIQETEFHAACYKPNIAFYEAFGPPGLEALKKTMDLIPPGTPVILDAKRNDIGPTAAAYAEAVFGYYGVDGVTLNPYLGKESITPFLGYPGKGLFVLCRTSNPGSDSIQGLTVYRKGYNALYLEIAREVARWGAKIGLVVGATDLPALRRIRAEFPGIWILAPGIGVQGGSLEETMRAGLRSDGMGILPVVARAIAQAPHPGEKARMLKERINLARLAGSGPAQVRKTTSLNEEAAQAESGTENTSEGRLDLSAENTSRETAALDLSAEHPSGETAALDLPAEHSSGEAAHLDLPAEDISRDAARLDLLREIILNGCLRLGRFKLKSGKISPYYLDLRKIISNPELLTRIADAYAGILEGLEFDRLAAIPLAALPIASAVSLKKGIPFIYPRLVPKDHGSGNSIEGGFRPGERVVLLDDVITTGGSKLEAIKLLRQAGLEVEDLVVLVERDEAGRQELANWGIRVHSYAGLLELLNLSESVRPPSSEVETAGKS